MPLKRLLGNSLHQAATSVTALLRQSCGRAEARAGLRLCRQVRMLLAMSVSPPSPNGSIPPPAQPGARVACREMGPWLRRGILADLGWGSNGQPQPRLLSGGSHPAPVRRCPVVLNEPKDLPGTRSAVPMASSCWGGLLPTHPHVHRAAHPVGTRSLQVCEPCTRAHPTHGLPLRIPSSACR